MEDKWFIVFDDGELLFYRSWTGICVFGVAMTSLPSGEAQLANAWLTAEEGALASYDLALANDDLAKQVETLVSDEFQVYKEQGPYAAWPEPE
jgi:hypothetical protein